MHDQDFQNVTWISFAHGLRTADCDLINHKSVSLAVMGHEHKDSPDNQVLPKNPKRVGWLKCERGRQMGTLGGPHVDDLFMDECNLEARGGLMDCQPAKRDYG